MGEEENAGETVCFRVPGEAKQALDERRGRKSMSAYMRSVVLDHLGSEHEYTEPETDNFEDRLSALEYDVNEIKKCVKHIAHGETKDKSGEGEKKEGEGKPVKKNKKSILETGLFHDLDEEE